MNKALIGFVASGAVLISATAFVMMGDEKGITKLPDTVPEGQVVDEAELAKIVAAGPKPGTFTPPTAPPPTSPGVSPSAASGASSATTPTAPPATTTTTVPLASGISRAELAKHNTQTDCWVAFEGSVYDVTTFIPKHPGGAEAIAGQCGTAEKFETAFIQQHGRAKVQMMMKVAPLKGTLESSIAQ
jgi:predicted heme/steroid binding protein